MEPLRLLPFHCPVESDFGQQAVERRGHRRKLGVVVAQSLDRIQLHVDLVAGAHLGDENIVVNRSRVARHLSRLIATWNPRDLVGEHLVIHVQLIGVIRVRGRVGVFLAADLKMRYTQPSISTFLWAYSIVK